MALSCACSDRYRKPSELGQDHIVAAASLKTRIISARAIACCFRLSAAAADSSTSVELCCVT